MNTQLNIFQNFHFSSFYRWTTGKDTRYEDYDPEAPSDSLIGMLRQMKYNQLSRNELFYELCRYVFCHFS